MFFSKLKISVNTSGKMVLINQLHSLVHQKHTTTKQKNMISFNFDVSIHPHHRQSKSNSSIIQSLAASGNTGVMVVGSASSPFAAGEWGDVCSLRFSFLHHNTCSQVVGGCDDDVSLTFGPAATTGQRCLLQCGVYVSVVTLDGNHILILSNSPQDQISLMATTQIRWIVC